MITITRSNAMASGVMVVALILTATLAMPAIASASVYAYVDHSGNVRSTEAGTWQSAIATAPNIGVHSGVMLLNNLNDGVVGSHVNGF